MDSPGLWFSFLNSLGIMSLLGMAYGLLIRQHLGQITTCACGGFLFGLGAMISMAHPLVVADGVYVDLRTLFVGSAGAFLGPVGACIAALLAAGTRMFQGGMGMVAGVANILIASLMGFAWSRLTAGHDRADLPRLLLLGLMISVSLSAWVLVPSPARSALWTQGAGFVSLFNAIGAVIFGAFIERERQLSRREARLFNEAGTDALTGLLNRRGLQDRFACLASDTSYRGTTLLVIDLDHFKAINDSYGHAVGDEILQMVAVALRHAVRAKDLVARMGGEEFVVVLADTDEADARATAERIRTEIERARLHADLPGVTITTSVGGYWAKAPLELVDGLKRADAALYQAKASGRNAVRFANLRTRIAA